jgi:hypothetical protein
MKAIKSLAVVFLVIAVSCGKQNDCYENENQALLNGKWKIVQVDSGYVPVYPAYSYHPVDTLALTGAIAFNADNSGIIEGSVDELTCSNTKFSFVYEDSISTIRLIMDDHYTKAIVEKLTQDSLILQMEDFCRDGQRIGATAYYNFKLVREYLTLNKTYLFLQE